MHHLNTFPHESPLCFCKWLKLIDKTQFVKKLEKHSHVGIAWGRFVAEKAQLQNGTDCHLMEDLVWCKVTGNGIYTTNGQLTEPRLLPFLT